MNELRFERTSSAMRAANLAAVFLPLLGVVAAIGFLWGRGVGWIEFGLLLGMYAVTGLGITVGYHRLFTHRSFEATPVVQVILAALGSMTLQGSLVRWVAVHRCHHHHSDTREDPHSPHFCGSGIRGLLVGFFHAHVGWILKADPADLGHYVKDLWQSKLARTVSALFPVWVTLGLLIPAVLGGLLTWTWMGALLGLLWGGLVRIFLTQHVTWSVNSVCHIWGRRPFPTADHSRNNLVFGVLALGEGWHNNHHAFPTSARHGLRWWETDVSYAVIRGLELLGLAWNVKVPTKEAQAARSMA